LYGVTPRKENLSAPVKGVEAQIQLPAGVRLQDLPIMASPSSPAGHNHTASEKGQANQQATHPQDHDSKYYETERKETIPTKTEPDQDVHHESERPGSAGTTNGAECNIDKVSEADEDVITKNTVNSGMTETCGLGFADSGSVTDYFTRPDVSDGIDTNQLFQFGHPNHQHQTNESSATLDYGSQDNAGEHSLIVDNQGLPEWQSALSDHEADHHAQQTNAFPQAGPIRVQKRKSKPSRKTTYATQARPAGSNEWKVADYGNLFVLKVQEYERAQQIREAAFASEREALQAELQHLVEARTIIKSNLDNVLLENGQLTTTIGQQKQKIATYESKFQSFKKFVDGVGKDIDTMRKDANTLRRMSDEIVAEVAKGRIIRQSDISIEMNGHIENCQKIKREAVNLARERDEELHRAILHRDQLQQQLSDTVGLLSEQRDRCTRLERQLQESEDRLIEGLKVNQTNHNTVLDKLHLIHTAVEQSKGDAVKMIEQLRLAAEATGSPKDSQDIADVKAHIRALDEKFVPSHKYACTQS
jgi:hypothetical protein